MTDALPYTAELLARTTATIAAYRREHGQGIDTRRLAIGLLNNDVGLVDLTRRQALVDERVYASVLERARAAEDRLRADPQKRQHPPKRVIPATVWKGLPT